MRRRLLFLPLLWLAALCSVVHGQKGCQRHERCVALDQCLPLARLIAKGRVPTAADRARLRAAACGWSPSTGKLPQVCCPLVPLDVCGPQNTPNKIVGGNMTVVKEFPWAARLGYRWRGRLLYQCGGTLISDRYVITAAHCVENRKKPVSVRLGEHDAESDVDCSTVYGQQMCADPVVDVDVEEIIQHPEYEPDTKKSTGLWNDIAIIRLKRPVNFSESVMPLCLPLGLGGGAQTPPPPPGEFTHIVVGWGLISSDVYSEASRYLLKLALREMDHDLCVEKYSGVQNRINEERQMCFIGKNGQDVCQGDSGGPLSTVAVINGNVVNVLTGVVSFGPSSCATNGVPGVFARVSHYVPWILANLKTR